MIMILIYDWNQNVFDQKDGNDSDDNSTYMAACKALVDYLDNYGIDDGCDDDTWQCQLIIPREACSAAGGSPPVDRRVHGRRVSAVTCHGGGGDGNGDDDSGDDNGDC